MTTSVIPPGMFKCLTCGYFHEASPCPVCTPSVPHDREASIVAMRAVLTFHPDLTPDEASSLVHRAEQNQDSVPKEE